MRLVAATLLALAVAGCHHDPLRDLVEKDTTGDTLAVGACSDMSRKLPGELCSRVAVHAAERIVASAKPQAFDCDETLALVDRLAPEKLPTLAAKCCFVEYGLDVSGQAICKRVNPPRPARPPVPWANDREWGFVHSTVAELERGEQNPPEQVKLARDICAKRKKDRPIPDCASPLLSRRQ